MESHRYVIESGIPVPEPIIRASVREHPEIYDALEKLPVNKSVTFPKDNEPYIRACVNAIKRKVEASFRFAKLDSYNIRVFRRPDGVRANAPFN